MNRFTGLVVAALSSAAAMTACTQILGGDFRVMETGSSGSTGGHGGDAGAGAMGGSVAGGGGTTSSTGGGGSGGGPACGAPGESCCSEGPACDVLTCTNGTCPEVARLIQVAKPSPYSGTYGIDETEVTRGQYEQWLLTNPTNSGALLGPGCATNGAFVPDATCMNLSSVCQGAGCGNHPQVCVDWCDAFAYCAAVGKKLCDHVQSNLNATDLDPLSSAWTNACTSGGLNDYSPGNSPGDCRTGSFGTTVEVMSEPTCQSTVPGYQGVFDLTGNVQEWVDVCDGTQSPTDRCMAPGGYFGADPPYELCIFPDDFERMDARYVVGLRCCEL